MVKLKTNVNKLLLSLAFIFSVISNIILAVNISSDAPSAVMGLVFGLMLVSATWALISLLPEHFKSQLFSSPGAVSLDSDNLAGEILQKSQETIKPQARIDQDLIADQANDISAESLRGKIANIKRKQDHAHPALGSVEQTGDKHPSEQVTGVKMIPSQPIPDIAVIEIPDIKEIEEFDKHAKEIEAKLDILSSPEKAGKSSVVDSIKNLDKMAEKQSEIQCHSCKHFRKCVFVMKGGVREAIINEQGVPSCALDKDSMIFMTEHSGWLSNLDKSEGFICPGTCSKFEKKSSENKDAGGSKDEKQEKQEKPKDNS